MKTKAFDRKFERDVDLTTDLDLSTTRHPTQAPRRVNVDFPGWMIDSLDQEAAQLGVTRQSSIKVWIAKRLKKRAS